MSLLKFYETIPGFLTWSTILLMFVFSWLAPAATAIFIILFDIYWLFKTIYLSFHLRATFKKMRENLKIDWLEKLKQNAATADDWQKIYHLVVFPMYKEPCEVVRESFESLVKSNYPKDKFIAVLAIEERGGKADRETAEKIEKEFGDKFLSFWLPLIRQIFPASFPAKGPTKPGRKKEKKKLIIHPLFLHKKIFFFCF